MSPSNGYYNEMIDPTASDQALETALAGRETPIEDSAVSEFVSEMRREADRLEPPANSETHIAAAVAAVPEMIASAPSTTRPKVRPRRLRRRMVLLASVMGLLLATAGVGFAADGAAPGDPLHGLDLALETFGIGAGGPSERSQEVLDLLHDGQVGLALSHAAATVATLPEQSQAEAANALEAASSALEAAETAPEGVGELLEYLAAALASDSVNGFEVAEIAKRIGERVAQDSPPVDPPADVPPGPPVSTPGQSNVPAAPG